HHRAAHCGRAGEGREQSGGARRASRSEYQGHAGTTGRSAERRCGAESRLPPVTENASHRAGPGRGADPAIGERASVLAATAPGCCAALAEVPGLGVDSAQQIIAEVGPTAATFPSAKCLASWVGTCPGVEESAEVSNSSRSPKGNRNLRRLLNQAAHAAVKTKGSIFEVVFRR